MFCTGLLGCLGKSDRSLPPERQLVPVNRDHLNRYRGGRRILIANGWYLHNRSNWPPAPELDPVFVSFHMADAWQPGDEALGYLRRHAPIGCRDLSTVRRLQAYGVDAYFTGCLSLTLTNPFSAEARTGPVVLCDADLGYDGGYPPSARSMVQRLIPSRVLEGATVVEQECAERYRNDYRWKTRRAMAQLELLARARLVITTRLHCALPCRALGTPVILLHQNYHNDSRFDGLRDALQGYGPDTQKIEIDWDNPWPIDITPFRERITAATITALEVKLGKITATGAMMAERTIS